MNQLSNDKVLEMAEMFHILGEPNRLGIVLCCLDEPVAVGTIAETLGITPSLTSHHLRFLRAVRLLKGQRKGKHVFYTIDDHHVRNILQNMIEHLQEEIDEL